MNNFLRHKLNLKTELGQHLTVDKQILQDIVDAAAIDKDDIVIEIGSGTGVLTELLCEKTKKVIAYEVDHQFKFYLDKLCIKYQNLEVRFENIRRAKINFFYNKVVGNISYHIVEPLLWKFRLRQVDLMIFVVSKKFAYTLTQDFTKQKVDSEIPLIFQSRFKIELLKIYPKTGFYPPPPVGSALIRLTPIPKESLKNNFIRYIIRYLFGHKNSKLKNALREGLIDYWNIAKNSFLSKKQAHNMIDQIDIPQEKLDQAVDGANIFEEIVKLRGLDKLFKLTSS